MNRYYEEPTLVLFDCDEEECLAGIAYHDTVICACCGYPISIGEVEIIEELPWDTRIADIIHDF